MSDKVFYRLRDILDSMPNGFPPAADGLEIRILKKIFSEEEAAVAVSMKMKFETPEDMAMRTGMDAAYLKVKLREMTDKGQIFGATVDGVDIYKLVPFIFGIYEYQVKRLDGELARMTEHYLLNEFGKQFASTPPSLMKVVPVEQEIPHGSVIEPYESLKQIIENGKSWAVEECICKKEKRLVGEGCDNPFEVCLGIAPLENFFDTWFWGRPITKDEALAVLKKAEDAGLVHMTSNRRDGHVYICNCCGCCCGILRGINELGILGSVAHSNYRAVVEQELCTSCEACLGRCQVRAINMNDVAVVNERCIGCGLCASVCPAGAIKLIRRDREDIVYVPADEREWMKERARSRGRDDYEELLK
jgi:electron transport complex protein RnfB